VHVAESASKVVALIRTIITPFATSEPPTVFSALLAEFVRSRVKLTLDGPEKLCFVQLSITPVGISPSPHIAKVFFKKSFLSILSYVLDNERVRTLIIAFPATQ
jgi:hypothetical protein